MLNQLKRIDPILVISILLVLFFAIGSYLGFKKNTERKTDLADRDCVLIESGDGNGGMPGGKFSIYKCANGELVRI